MKILLKTVLIITLLINTASLAKDSVSNFSDKKFTQKYEAIVSGKLTKSKVLKSGNLYFTEYKLKTTSWLFKRPYIKEKIYIKIKILGADLQKKGMVIKASISPENIVLNKEAVFLLNKTRKQNVYTIPKEGIIYKETL